MKAKIHTSTYTYIECPDCGREIIITPKKTTILCGWCCNKWDVYHKNEDYELSNKKNFSEIPLMNIDPFNLYNF